MLAAECSVLCSMVSEPNAMHVTCCYAKLCFALLLYNAASKGPHSQPKPTQDRSTGHFLHVAFAVVLG